MKRILIVVLLVLVAVPAFAAQNSAVKGNFVVSLPLFSYNTGMGDLDKYSEVSFLAMGYEPEVQYFVIDNLAVGGKVGIKKTEVEGTTTKTYSFGPMANYYLSMIKAPILPYAGAGFLYEKEGDVKTTSFQVQGGAVYMFGKYLGGYGELALGYETIKAGESLSGTVVKFSVGVKAFF